MIAAGFLAALFNWSCLAKREGKPREYAGDLGFWLLLSGIIGARVAYILANWDYYAQTPLEIILINKGGLVYYGGFLAAAGAAVIFNRIRREPFWPFTDFAITSLPLGHAFGRFGCFLNGCCYGRESEFFSSLSHQAYQKHPVQLYEAFGELAVFIILLNVYKRKSGTGLVFSLYLVLYPILRFVCEFFRGDPRLRAGSLTLAQIASLSLLLAGAALLSWRLRATSSNGTLKTKP